MTRQLIFIHGRAQENKDPAALKQEWVTAWEEGLKKSGHQLPLQDEDIRFPYYGQTLWDYARGIPQDEAAKVVIKGAEGEDDLLLLIGEALEAARLRAGISDAEVLAAAGPVAQKGVLNWEWVQGLLKVMDGHAGLSGLSVALATRDVHQYLNNANFRQSIDEEVEKALSHPGEKVIVSHSLGTVVAYSILKARNTEAKDVPLFVTLGSPLGVTSVRAGVEPVKYPASIGDWYNAMDERDVVALYPLEKPRFGIKPEIRNKVDVSNHTKNRHGISGYLDDKDVALEIYNAITAA